MVDRINSSTPLVDQGASAATRPGLSLLKKTGRALYGGTERAAGRQNYFRNLDAAEWKWLYGKRYRYASDYIHAHADEFRRGTRTLAKLGNRTEELAELVFRITGIWCRLSGSLWFRALREMSGRARFSRRMHASLASSLQGTATGAANWPNRQSCEFLFDRLLGGAGVTSLVTRRGSLKCPPAEAATQLIERLKKPPPGESCPQDLQALINDEDRLATFKLALENALRRADLTRTFTQNTLPQKLCMTMGCSLSAAAYAAVYMGMSLGLSTLASTFLLKAGFLSGSLYLSAFALKVATTLQARLTYAYRGSSIKPVGSDRVYRSLFDLGSRRLLALRNTCFPGLMHAVGRSDWKMESAGEEATEKAWKREADSILTLWADDQGRVPVLAKALAAVSMTLHRATDVIFSMDRIIGMGLVARPSKQFLFRYHGSEDQATLKHYQGISAAGKCNYNITYKKADDTVSGRFRRGLASLIGHGGVDCLGMAVGCATCSTAWTSMNVGLPGGGIAAISVSDACTATIGMGFASVCALGWAASALVDGAAKVVDATAQRVHGRSGNTDAPRLLGDANGQNGGLGRVVIDVGTHTAPPLQTRSAPAAG